MSNKGLFIDKNSAALLITLLGLLFALASTAIAKEQSEAGKKSLLLSLFPGSSAHHFERVLGDDTHSDVICEIKLRGRSGFIPIAKVTTVTLSPSLSAIAFPIYLHDTRLPQNDLIKASPDATAEKSKLLQLIFYNHNNGQLYGKPEGFPLISTGWTCGGDLCDNLEITSLEPIENSTKAVVLKYAQGVANHRLYALAFNGSTIITSRALDYGELGGESGVSMSLDYSEWREANGSITAMLTSECDKNEIEYCKSAGILPGNTTKRVHILNINAR